MLSKNDVERERYQARLKWERDQTAFVDEAEEKGEWIGRVRAFQQMLKIPVTPREQLRSLRLEDLQRKAKTLEEQIDPVQD